MRYHFPFETPTERQLTTDIISATAAVQIQAQAARLLKVSHGTPLHIFSMRTVYKYLMPSYPGTMHVIYIQNGKTSLKKKFSI